MIIESKYSDYYDCGLAYGRDESIFYKRLFDNPLTDKAPQLETLRRGHFGTDSLIPSYIAEGVKANVVGFCGKLYPVISVQTKNKKGVLKTDYIYSYSEFERTYSYILKRSWHTKEIRKFFSLKELPVNFFKEYEVPIFIIKYFYVYKEVNGSGIPSILDHRSQLQTTGLILNPILKEFDFQKVVEPHTAFQEISMYVNWLHNKEVTPVQVDDKITRDSKGFYDKSFKHRK